MALNDNKLIMDLDKFKDEDFAYFGFKASMKARWKELKHSFHLLRKSPLFLIGFFIIVTLVVLAVLAPYIAPYKCYGTDRCEIAKNSVGTHSVLKNLPPMTRDTRITKIDWSVQGNADISAQFPQLAKNPNGVWVSDVVVNNKTLDKVLVGTGDGQLLLYSFNVTGDLTTYSGEPNFYLESNTTFPLPALPANLTTVIPSAADLNNDSNFDLVVGGNTGEIYVSLNLGNNTVPNFTPFKPIVNFVNKVPLQFNSAITSPTIFDWDISGQPDIIFTTSNNPTINASIHWLTQYTKSDAQDLPIDGKPYMADFGNNSVYFQLKNTGYTNYHYTYLKAGSHQFKPFQLNLFNDTGVLHGIVRSHFSQMDPTSPGSWDMVLTFGTGESFVILLQNTPSSAQLSQFSTASQSDLFNFPPLPDTPGNDFLFHDYSGDTYSDLLTFFSNGTVLYQKQFVHIDGRMHWLGTDDFGGDIFSKIIYAFQYDLVLAMSIVGFTVLIGVIIGSISGYFGGIVDNLFMRITDIFFAFPDLILAMAITAVLGKSMLNIAIALILVGWAGTARLIRGQVLSEKTRLYVEAAKASGIGNFRIIYRHVLPNSIYPIIVTATLGMGGVILAASGLAFLGFGPGAGSAELGRMITDGRSYINTAPWIVFFPGLAIMLIVLSFNLVGDAIRDILDPRLRR